MAKFTKEAIMNSFLKLLEVKSFEKITVKDIVEDCGVNRKTFYYYFADIYDLAEQIFKSETEKFMRSVTSDMSVEETINNFCDLIEKNKKTVSHAFFASDEIEMRKFFNDVLFAAFEKKIRENAIKYRMTNDDIETVTRIFVFSFLGSVIAWIYSGYKEEEREKLKKLCVLFQGSLKKMLDNLDSYNNANN